MFWRESENSLAESIPKLKNLELGGLYVRSKLRQEAGLHYVASRCASIDAYVLL